MRPFLSMLLAFGLAASCTFHAGDVFTGRYRKTLLAGELSEAEVTFTFAPESWVVETSTNVVVFSRWIQAGPNVVIQAFGGDTTCAVTDVAKYDVSFNADCSVALLEVVHDDCTTRTSLFTTMTLTRAEHALAVDAAGNAACPVLAGDVWRGAYPAHERSPLAGEPVVLVFAPRGATVELSAKHVVFSVHERRAADDAVLVRDVAGQPSACAAASRGAYRVRMSATCTQLTFAELDETCAERLERLDDIVLSRTHVERDAPPLPAHMPAHASIAARQSYLN